MTSGPAEAALPGETFSDTEADETMHLLRRALQRNPHGQITYRFEGHAVNIRDLINHVEHRDEVGLSYVRHTRAMEAARNESPIVAQTRRGIERIKSGIRFILDNHGKQI